MENLIPLMAIISVFVILPGMVLWFFDRQRRSRREEGTPQQAPNADLLKIAERMEKRIDALERILDTEAPGWRSRHHG